MRMYPDRDVTERQYRALVALCWALVERGPYDVETAWGMANELTGKWSVETAEVVAFIKGDLDLYDLYCLN